MPLRRVRLPLVLAALCLVLGWPLAGQSPRPGPAIVVSIAPGTANVPVDGRLLVIVSTRKEGEPRFQVSDAVNTEQVFGVDVENVVPGGEIAIDASALGYPVEQLADVPAGRYRVQARGLKLEAAGDRKLGAVSGLSAASGRDVVGRDGDGRDGVGSFRRFGKT